MEKIVVNNEGLVVERLRQEIEKCAANALKHGNCFRVGLSGGSVLNYLCEAIPQIQSDFSKWKFYFCDERYVPSDSDDSTFGCYKRIMLPKTQFTEKQFAQINLSLPLEECARDYEKRLLEDFQITEEVNASNMPSFDLLLLGMGPDGHTCSLFPNHPLLAEQKQLIAPIADSPKPPPQRVTMTFPLINNAKCCIFAMCGEGKAEMVKRIFIDKEPLPAGMVAPNSGRLIGIFDPAAGKYIK